MTVQHLDRVVTLMRRRMRLERVLRVAGPVAVVASGGLLVWWLLGMFVILPTIDAVLVAGFSGWLPGLLTLALLPLSIGLGRLFDVT